MARLNATQLRRLARHLDELDKLGEAVTGATVEEPWGRYAHGPVSVSRGRWESRHRVQIIAPGEVVAAEHAERRNP